MTEIREAGTGDKDDVVRLWMDLLRSQGEIDDRFAPADDAEIRWRNDYTEWLSRGSRRLFVADEDGAVCGFVTAERWSPPPVFAASSEIYIVELYVEPANRRKGIGSSLVEAVRDWAEDVGAKRIRAGILALNEDGGAFWTAVGGDALSVTFGIDVQDGERSRDDEQVGRSRLGF